MARTCSRLVRTAGRDRAVPRALVVVRNARHPTHVAIDAKPHLRASCGSRCRRDQTGSNERDTKKVGEIGATSGCTRPARTHVRHNSPTGGGTFRCQHLFISGPGLSRNTARPHGLEETGVKVGISGNSDVRMQELPCTVLPLQDSTRLWQIYSQPKVLTRGRTDRFSKEHDKQPKYAKL